MRKHSLRKSVGFTLGLVVLTAFAITARVRPGHGDESPVTYRSLPASTVASAVYSGPLQDSETAVQSLTACAQAADIQVVSPVFYRFMNVVNGAGDPNTMTEIQLPVAQGQVITPEQQNQFVVCANGANLPGGDVKTEGGVNIAAITKPAGITDTHPLYDTLYNTLGQDGYTPTGGPGEAFVSVALGGEYGNFTTEIQVAVQ